MRIPYTVFGSIQHSTIEFSRWIHNWYGVRIVPQSAKAMLSLKVASIVRGENVLKLEICFDC